ncbi:hypothetical protein [Thalassospira lucentensis]|uniref:hypothetical protein n=1 Tax=Thalassospira lucentensis TaxID=168935 RepID=UPI00399D79D4
MVSEQGVLWCKNEQLRHVKCLWPALTEILNIYVEKLTADLPHYHNERATVSFLNGAAWKAGLIAIEEYATSKIKDGVQYTGRCDLYIAEKNGIEIEFEAKQNWITGVAGADDAALSNWIDIAVEAARQNISTDLKYAVNFIVPEISGNLGVEQVSETYFLWKRQFLEKLRNNEEVELFYVWEHPEAMKRQLESRHGKGPCCWPGLWIAITRAF